jgi:phosphomannomutase/phosphoglucomutase
VSIYKPCDIRGRSDGELSAELFEQWGLSLGGRLSPGAKFVVGNDVRDSSPRFATALMQGLCRAGLDVVYLGTLPTPMVYHAKQRVSAAGCAIVTASHNAAEINGLKWMLGDRPPTPDDVAAMGCGAGDEGRGAEDEGRKKGEGGRVKGEIEERGERREESEKQRPKTQDPRPKSQDPRPKTDVRALDVSFDYVAHLQETFVDSLAARLHVVLDPMHGCWARKARRYLHAIFPQCLITAIHDEPLADFGGRKPDCSRVENLLELSDAVYHQRAHLGAAFDGDGDRLALVDGDGVVLSPEEAALALMDSLGKSLRGSGFVHDVKFSDHVPDAARRHGAEPLAERSGHAFIRARMIESSAAFGAELSGHYFHRELHGGEDPLYTLCRLVARLARDDVSLSELRRRCPSLHITPELRLTVADGERDKMLSDIRAAWSGFPQRTLDGVRIDLPGGWALARPSVTEPALTFRFEGLDWHALDDLVERFCATLPPPLDDKLREQYRAACGGAEI